MKKHFLGLFLLVLISVALPLAASAKIVESGECGLNRTWTLDDSGLLIISGKGPVINHPWDSSKVIKVVIESGISRIGDSVFEKCSNLNNITIAKSVISIGNKAFPKKNSNLTIQCYFDSTAYEYAKSNNINVILLDEKPVITFQPSDVVVNEGETVRLKVEAIGATNYQWYYRTSSSAPWKKTADNDASASISFKAKDSYNEYQFRCLVKNSAGSVYSKIASLKVISESSNPTTTSNVKLDESKSLTIGTNNEKIKTLDAGTRNAVSPLLWLGLTLAFLVLSLSIPMIQRSHVKRYSALYNGLLSLNKKYSFSKDIPDSYSVTHIMRSKQALESANENEIFLYELYNDSNLKVVFKKITDNRSLYEKYIEEYNELKEKNIPNNKINANVEQQMCKKIIQNPIRDIKINLKLEYNSSGGRNHYSRLYSASYNNLLYVFTEVPRREISRYQAQIERSKMSAALRYQVLTRDGHRCVICGATAQDGVKLHVDHIVPVSKGGKTELSNLRTLCDRCNLGKGDKYNANGLN